MHLIKFSFDCGRAGELSGAFLVNAEGLRRLTALIATGRDVEFGEVLGRHSYVEGPIEQGDVTIIPLTDDVAEAVLTAFNGTLSPEGWVTLSGYNPLAYAGPEDPNDVEQIDHPDCL